MNLNIIDKISREKWLRALHIKGTPDDKLIETMDEAEKNLISVVLPKAIYRVIEIDDINLKGKSIEKHLNNCHSIILMAVTLGAGVDMLLRRIQVTDMAMAVILDTGASTLVEQYCDAFEKIIEAEIKGYTTSRFSPGYGDYPVTEQSYIIKLLDASKRIGLNVTSSNLMIPKKSVTAIMGVADVPVAGKLATCEECTIKDKCDLRKEGKTCGN